jgi:hypothetical protein
MRRLSLLFIHSHPGLQGFDSFTVLLGVAQYLKISGVRLDNGNSDDITACAV